MTQHHPHRTANTYYSYKNKAMGKRYFAESELIINSDGSVFHLHVKPEQLADKIILVATRDA